MGVMFSHQVITELMFELVVQRIKNVELNFATEDQILLWKLRKMFHLKSANNIKWYNEMNEEHQLCNFCSIAAFCNLINIVPMLFFESVHNEKFLNNIFYWRFLWVISY